jgi:hypothetical protein
MNITKFKVGDCVLPSPNAYRTTFDSVNTSVLVITAIDHARIEEGYPTAQLIEVMDGFGKRCWVLSSDLELHVPAQEKADLLKKAPVENRDYQRGDLVQVDPELCSGVIKGLAGMQLKVINNNYSNHFNPHTDGQKTDNMLVESIAGASYVVRASELKPKTVQPKPAEPKTHSTSYYKLKDYTLNPLSLQPGGEVVTVVYTSGKLERHPKVKFPTKYANKIPKEGVSKIYVTNSKGYSKTLYEKI